MEHQGAVYGLMYLVYLRNVSAQEQSNVYIIMDCRHRSDNGAEMRMVQEILRIRYLMPVIRNHWTLSENREMYGEMTIHRFHGHIAHTPT